MHPGSLFLLARPLGTKGFPGASVIKNPPVSEGEARDMSSIPGWGRPPGVGSGNPLQYSCLENSLDRGACQAIVHGVKKRYDLVTAHTRTRLEVNYNLMISTGPKSRDGDLEALSTKPWAH